MQIAGVGASRRPCSSTSSSCDEPALGIVKRGEFFLWAGGTILAGVIFYFAARAIRASQGVNVDRAFAEIPPE